jgi:hypothetical protein
MQRGVEQFSAQSGYAVAIAFHLDVASVLEMLIAIAKLEILEGLSRGSRPVEGISTKPCETSSRFPCGGVSAAKQMAIRIDKEWVRDCKELVRWVESQGASIFVWLLPPQLDLLSRHPKSAVFDFIGRTKFVNTHYRLFTVRYSFWPSSPTTHG